MKNNHKQFFCGCHDRRGGHLKALKTLLCGKFIRAEVKMEPIHTSVLLCSNGNRQQVKSCGTTHFFLVQIFWQWKTVKLHFQMGKKIYIPHRPKLFT